MKATNSDKLLEQAKDYMGRIDELEEKANEIEDELDDLNNEISTIKDNTRNILLTLADRGDKNAQNMVVEICIKSNYLPDDESLQTKCVKWVEEAATNGNVDAQFSIGMMYMYGHGVVKKSEKTGLKWLKLAADNGHGYALAIIEKIGDKKKSKK